MIKDNTDPMDKWPEFMEAIKKRLKAGKREYGDCSFTCPASEIAEEIEEELLDVAGWAFFLWLRIRRMRKSFIKGSALNST